MFDDLIVNMNVFRDKMQRSDDGYVYTVTTYAYKKRDGGEITLSGGSSIPGRTSQVLDNPYL